jgi:hypothetical protein
MTPAVSRLAQVQLGAAQGLIYTPPAFPPNTLVKVTTMWICNTDPVNPVNVTIRVGSGVLTAANSLLEQAKLDPASSWFFDTASDAIVHMNQGDTMQGLGSIGGAITVTLGGEVWGGGS